MEESKKTLNRTKMVKEEGLASFCFYVISIIFHKFIFFFFPQLETDKLALPMSPSPLSPSPMPSPNVKLENSTLLTVEPSPLDKNKCFFVDESEPLLRCDSTSSGSSALSRNGSFITKGTHLCEAWGHLPDHSHSPVVAELFRETSKMKVSSREPHH